MTDESKPNTTRLAALRYALETIERALPGEPISPGDQEVAVQARRLAARRRLAAVINYGEIYLSEMERDLRDVTWPVLESVAAAIEVPIGELLFRAEQPGRIILALPPEIARYLAGALRGEPWPPQARGELEALLRELEGAEEP